MARGIQLGQKAADAQAIQLDISLKQAAKLAFNSLALPGLTLQAKLTKEQIPGGIGGCAPDGGVWFYNGKLIAAFEAKKQGIAGNAIQRWYKNNYICRLIAPNISYVTICCGEGASTTIAKELNIAHLSGFNKLNVHGNSCFLAKEPMPLHNMIQLIEHTILASIYDEI